MNTPKTGKWCNWIFAWVFIREKRRKSFKDSAAADEKRLDHFID
jgi:hypothetical protein